MFSPRHQAGAFVLEGLNSFSTTWYFYYVYFFLSARFGFGAKENLLWGVMHGVVYVVASWQGGRFGQRRGYFRALQWGFGGLALALAAGALLERLPGRDFGLVLAHGAAMVAGTVAMCFTWPSLEAIVSEGEGGARLQRNLGVYNLVWAGCGAVAYFTGGALIEALGHGVIFWLPALILAGQWALAWRWGSGGGGYVAGAAPHGPLSGAAERAGGDASPQAFLRMAWLANPCAYVAISVAIPVFPQLAERFGLGAREAGFVGSVWLFTRLAAFLGLWRWTGWHYRFRWLAAAFLALTAGLVGIFTATTLAALVAAQVVFGLGIGLIYYSSLYYSMDVGDTKGDHGGIHEAAIGGGILLGPLLGAAAKAVQPGSFTAPAWAVGGALLAGFAALCWLRRDRPARAGRNV
jgi:predicted MFS family arabinose efflux permease